MSTPQIGDVVRVGRQRVHVTRVDSSGGVYGHTSKHCNECGCNGNELYFGVLEVES